MSVSTGKQVAHLKRFDAGLNELYRRALPGQVFTVREIAEACGVSHRAIELRQKRILEKLRLKLERQKML
jgi:DNA-directed RNA polymerase specialized sigma24 family protein